MGLTEFIFSFFFLFRFFFLFFSATFVRAISLEPLLAEIQIKCAAWSCCPILHYSLSSNSRRYFLFFSFFLPRFCPGHISGTITCRDSKLSVLLDLRSNFALLLTIQFALLLFFFFGMILPRFCPGHISGTVTCRDSKLSVLLGPAV